jgi:hypothetical protein
MSNQDNKTTSMTYKEAVKYMEQHGILTKVDRINLESQCAWDKPSKLSLSKKDIEAQEVVREHRIQEFLDYNSKLP